MDERALFPEKWQAQRAFDHAAKRYDEAAVVQREVAQRLDERLDLIKLQPSRVLDLGCGTGMVTTKLRTRYPRAEILPLDIAPSMVRMTLAQKRWYQRRWLGVCADAERLPLCDSVAELLVSNLMLQWCGNVDAVFTEALRVLRPGGLLMFATFGPDTLKELRASWAEVDTLSHVNAFVDMHDLGDALLRAGFVDPVMDVEVLTLTYASVDRLMRDLKTLGAHNVTLGRRRGLTGKQRMQAMRVAYERHRKNKVLPATYEVVYGHAWVPITPRAARALSGVATIPVDQLRGSRRRSE
jgi:malonyl-CoA O-methyltransferase